MPISTLEDGHPDAYVLLTYVARNVAMRAVGTYGQILAVSMKMHAVVAVIYIMSNAACLMAVLGAAF